MPPRIPPLFINNLVTAILGPLLGPTKLFSRRIHVWTDRFIPYATLSMPSKIISFTYHPKFGTNHPDFGDHGQAICLASFPSNKGIHSVSQTLLRPSSPTAGHRHHNFSLGSASGGNGSVSAAVASFSLNKRLSNRLSPHLPIQTVSRLGGNYISVGDPSLTIIGNYRQI